MKETIEVPVQHFDISGGAAPHADRKYCVLTLNYGTFRQHFAAYQYNVRTGAGEQRINLPRAVNKLKRAIQSFTYTPTPFNATILPENIVNIADKTAELKFTDKPIPVTNGFQRIGALESIRSESVNTRVIDNLPITVMISLDHDRRKEDFLNLNLGTPIHKSHMLQLSIDTDRVNMEAKPYLLRARELLLLLNEDKNLPFKDLVQFDQTTFGNLQAHVLMSTRKTDQLLNLYGTVKIGDHSKKSNKDLIKLMTKVYNLLDKETEVFEEENLLAFPPEGTKTGVLLFLGLFNQFIYYLYVSGKSSISKYEEKLLINASKSFEEPVDSTIGYGKRKSELMLEFGQELFREFLEESIMARHHGIPYSLMSLFGHACFGVDSPGKPIGVETKKRGRKKEQPAVENPVDVSVPTDTDPEFLRG